MENLELKLNINIDKVVDAIFEEIDNTFSIVIKRISEVLYIYPKILHEICMYDKESLRATIYFNLLFNLYDTYTEEVGIAEMIRKIAKHNPFCSEDLIRRRIYRLFNLYEKRSDKTKQILNISDDSLAPRKRLAEALYYDLMAEYPLIKRLIGPEVKNCSKKIFDEFNLIYERIDQYDGYNKFFLFYKLESNLKIEMNYKALMSVRKEKARLKLPDTYVQGLLYDMDNIHIVPEYYDAFLSFMQNDDCKIFNWMMEVPHNEKTVNGIVMNIDDIIQNYAKNPEEISMIFTILNFIQQTTYQYLSDRIYNILNVVNIDGAKLIEKIQMCDKTTKYFNNYLKEHPHTNRNKNCSRDIRFEHFKTIYGIKKEPPRTKNSI